MPAKKRTVTAPMDSHSLPGPETITRRALSNGIVVLARENFTSPSVVVDADLRVGALWHGRDQAGLSDFTSAALMRGTERRTFDQIYEQVESLGASLACSGGVHLSGFYAKCLAEDLGVILEIAADAVRRPTFPADQVEKLRSEILTRLAIHANDTRSRASEAFYELAYPGHPYSIDEEGYPETVRAITRDDLAEFHRSHFGPQGMIITVVGAVTADEAVALAEQHFGDWTNPAQMPQPALPEAGAPRGAVARRVAMPGKSQADILLGVPGPARSHPGFLAARLGNNILGTFGMGGRIGHAVREKGGMAYYAASSLNGGLGPGAWYAYSGVNPKNVDRAVELMLKELRRFTTRRVTAGEVEDSQAQFLGRLPLSLETNEGVAGNLSSLELYDLGLDYLQRYPDLIRAITRDEILETAREFLSADNYALAVAGPE